MQCAKWRGLIQELLKRFFIKFALLTSRHPKKFIAFPLLFTILCTPGAILNFNVLEDMDYQLAPINGKAIASRKRMHVLFPMNYSTEFSSSRQIELKYCGRLIIEAKDGGSVLRPHIFDEILDVDRKVKQLTVKKEGREWNYPDLCAKEENRCYEPQLLSLKTAIPDISGGIYKIEYPLNVDWKRNTFQQYFIALGGMELDPENHIISSKAAALEYPLDATNPDLSGPNREWEDLFLRFGEQYVSDNISLYRFMSRSLFKEGSADLVRCAKYLALTIGIMLAFGMATSMMSDCVRSKPWVGLLGSISSTLAVGAAFGLLLSCGAEFIISNMIIPFLLLGIGLDDSFVILAAWRRTDPSKGLEERVVETYQHAGLSITLTSFTNFISFLMGTTTSYHACNLFCSYAALSVVFAYIYQLCFFGGFFVLFGHAEQRNLHGLTFREATPKSLAKHQGKWFQLCCTGGRDPDNPGNPKDNKDHLGMVLFRDWLGGWLSQLLGKIFVLIVYFIYLAAAIYGCFLIKEGLNFDDFFVKSSFANNYVLKDREYFYNYIMRYQVVIDEPLDYSNKMVQQKYLDTISKLESLPFSSKSNLTESWLRHYLQFLGDKRSEPLVLWRYNLSDKVDFYQCLRNFFLKHPLFKNYKYDVVFDNNGTEILASRFFVQTEGVEDFIMIQKLTVRLWSFLDNLPLKNTFIYHPLMCLVESQVGIPKSTFRTVAISGVVIMVITFAFIPQFTYSIAVAFIVVSIEIGVIGFISYMNVNLNLITMVTLISSVGFSVDNAAHITYAYISSKVPDPNEKMRQALYFVGVPISQSCFSTIFGVALLMLTQSHFFQVFSKMIIIVMIFSLVHSLFLLPVILSLIEHLLEIIKSKNQTQMRKGEGKENETDIPFLFKKREEIPF